ncbi:hypothetical protein GJR98_05725 [Haloferax sp. MBLA0077]|uniref:Uncharacterized protein n=2 Tax=Haloferax TaxID=2251 RepID=A0A6G1Z117_9EURY|nr:hypothetical protein [Haloferax marinisediminis]KAB1187556.1 hypothetical protein Hfx1149_05740 [Haloferax sp. CBA1149]MRW80212.1 hypothetical protein [Haloferax marinisediminis]
MKTLGGAAVASTAFAAPAAAGFGTGGTWPSTNTLNKNKQAPGRVGQNAPYVEVDDVGPGAVTLNFVNQAPGLAYFEYRADGEELGSGNHPVVNADGEHDVGGSPPRDSIYSGVGVPSGNTETKTLEAKYYVEVRLALGGERDWDFDWVRFDVGQPETKDDCKKGGWEDYHFKNQGQCVRYVETGKDSR